MHDELREDEGGEVKVYIAGPYTQGDQMRNITRAIEAGQELLDSGYVPFVPHLYGFWHLLYPNSYDTWLELDLEWLKACKALIRLPGASSGADSEVQAAKDWGIPVYYSVQEFLADQGAP